MIIKTFNLSFANKKILFIGTYRWIPEITSTGGTKIYYIPRVEEAKEYIVEPYHINRMFSKLGYNKGCQSFYINKKGSHIFFKADRTIDLSGRGTGKTCDSKNKILNMKELLAIVAYCLEQNWITIEENELHIPKEIIDEEL